jgi:hypothetical protein
MSPFSGMNIKPASPLFLIHAGNLADLTFKVICKIMNCRIVMNAVENLGAR